MFIHYNLSSHLEYRGIEYIGVGEKKMEEDMVKKLYVKRNTKNPFLHDLFKSTLVYKAEEVKKKLERRIGGKLLSEWELDRPYLEILGRGRKGEGRSVKADVIWLLKHPGREELGFRRIIHEIKTGNYFFTDIFEKYNISKFLGTKMGYSWAITTNTPLYIWAWEKYHGETDPNVEGRKKIERGAIRLCFLEEICEFLEEGIKEVFE